MIKIKEMYEMLAHHYLNRKRVTNLKEVIHSDKMLIVATGNSARSFWNDKSIRDKFKDYDMLFMNRTVYKMKELIYELKPKYLALCDPIYWGERSSVSLSDSIRNETHDKTCKMLESIDWDCYLLTTIHENFTIKNPNIKIIRMNATEINENNKLDYMLYRGNYANPGIRNVGQLSIYSGITLGYKEIGILGMDFDFIKNIHCDEQCRLWDYADHSYDTDEKSKIITYLENEGEINGSILAKYFYEYYRTMSSFGKLQMYAENEECQIINYSEESMIDCFKKGKI